MFEELFERHWIGRLRAKFSDIAEIWDGSAGEYPASGPVTGWFGFRLRVKCSICMLFGWERKNDWDHVPVWVSGNYVGHGCDGPTCDWWEVGVGYGWRNWTYSRYKNGI